MIEGSPEFQKRSILNEYDDIFSYNVKGKAMCPMTFAVDKHAALNKWSMTC